MYKVFIEDKVIYLTFNASKELFNENYSFISENKVSNFWEENKDFDKKIINFYSHKRLNEFLENNFKIITAGGGLVVNENKEILMIFRNGKWDLPKGKIEKGEKIKEGAVREVKEECGVKKIEVIERLKTTYHTYKLKESRVLKESIWYLMSCRGDQKLIPQKEEGITKVEWVSKKDVSRKMKNTYENIKEVISAYEAFYL